MKRIKFKPFVSRKKLIKTLSEELAYLQICADWWYYVSACREDTRKEMSSKMLNDVTELKNICVRLGVVDEVYEAALKIYDFRNSGKRGFSPDIGLISILKREFCEPIKKRRVLI